MTFAKETLSYNLPDQRIDLHTLHVIQLLQCLPDLPLVCLDIAYKHQRIVLLDLLHRALGIQRVDDDLVVVEAGLMGDRFAWVFWGS